MIPILEAATADRVGEDGKVRARPPPRSLKSAMKAGGASAQVGGGAATEDTVTRYPTATGLDATDSDDDADEDGEALVSGMAIVSMPEGADDNFFGDDDGGAGSQWEEEWEETFFDGALTARCQVADCWIASLNFLVLSEGTYDQN